MWYHDECAPWWFIPREAHRTFFCDIELNLPVTAYNASTSEVFNFVDTIYAIFTRYWAAESPNADGFEYTLTHVIGFFQR